MKRFDEYLSVVLPSTAEVGFLPAWFSRVNRFGAPVFGMLAIIAVQLVLLLVSATPQLFGHRITPRKPLNLFRGGIGATDATDCKNSEIRVILSYNIKLWHQILSSFVSQFWSAIRNAEHSPRAFALRVSFATP